MKEKKEKQFICIITYALERKLETFNADGMNHAALIVSELLKKLKKKPEKVTISRIKETIGIDLDKLNFIWAKDIETSGSENDYPLYREKTDEEKDLMSKMANSLGQKINK